MLRVGTPRGPFETIVNTMHPGFRVSSAIPWHTPGAPWGAEGCTYSHLGEFLGLPGDSLGCPRAPSGALLGALGASPGSPGTPCVVPPGLSRDSLGTPCGLPGTPRDSLGTPLGPPRYSPGVPGAPRGLPGVSRDSPGSPGTLPGLPCRLHAACPKTRLNLVIVQVAHRWHRTRGQSSCKMCCIVEDCNVDQGQADDIGR